MRTFSSSVHDRRSRSIAAGPRPRRSVAAGKRRPGIGRATSAGLPSVLLLLGACGGDSTDSITGPQAESCGPPPYFTVLPVPAERIRSVPVVGGVDAPGHTLPTDHGAFFIDGSEIPLRAPAGLTVTALSRGRYSGEGIPPGTEDYAIYFQACKELTGWFGHVVALGAALSPSTIQFGNCRTYSTPFVTVESCEARDVNIEVRAGDVLALATGAADFGVADERVTNFYVSPQRFNGPSHAVCMWEQFDPANQAVLFSKLRDLRRPEIEPTGEPRCGTMEVDVPATAKGVWADPGITGPVTADERGYMALVDYPYRPQMELALSLGPEALGARLAVVERRTTGRVNRAFEDVGPDGLIYCYGPAVEGFAPSSWFLQLTSATAMRIEHVDHGAGGSPCGDDPSTWSFGATAVTMVR